MVPEAQRRPQAPGFYGVSQTNSPETRPSVLIVVAQVLRIIFTGPAWVTWLAQNQSFGQGDAVPHWPEMDPEVGR